MLDIVFETDHARRRMRERGITLQDVQITLEHPDRINPGDDEVNLYERRFTDGRTLRVYVRTPERQRNTKVVATCVWKG